MCINKLVRIWRTVTIHASRLDEAHHDAYDVLQTNAKVVVAVSRQTLLKLAAERKNRPMLNLPRRVLLRDSGIVAFAFTLFGLEKRAMAREQGPDGNFIHIFGFQWKPSATPDLIERARTEILAFQGVIPGLLETHVGPNLSQKGKGYTFAGMMRFSDHSSLEAYPRHPAHEALLVWLVPLIDAVELDIKA